MGTSWFRVLLDMAMLDLLVFGRDHVFSRGAMDF